MLFAGRVIAYENLKGRLRIKYEATTWAHFASTIGG